MKKTIFYLLFVLSAKFGFPQSEGSAYGNLPNYDPPSPEASALGKFVDHPVGNFTGIPKIDIPLFEIKAGRIEVPISLSYHASGIKVNDVASRVGLGWVLNAGGVVTRTVKGFPDDVGGATEGNSSIVFSYFNGGSKSQVSAIYDEPMQRTNVYDLEPDVYFYNFGDKMGKMYFLDPTHVALCNDDPLIVSGPFTGTNKFTITDEKGIIYTFESQEVSTYIASFYYTYNSSWFLSKIYDPVTNESVSFIYNSNLPELTLNYLKSNSSGIPCTSSATYEQVRMLVATSQVLSRIVYDSGYIQFDAGLQRQDLTGDYAYTKISQYVYENRAPLLVKGYNLAYSFTSTGSGGQEGQRLYLNSVQEFGSDNAILPPYSFYYKNANALPNRNSAQQDVWGYYNANGVTVPDDYPPPLPKVYIHNHGTQTDYLPFNTNDANDPPTQIIDGAEMSCNPATVDAGTLYKITYPTGGYTIYTYEVNQFNTNYTGGGIRIKEINDYSSSAQLLLSKSYQYSGGFLGGPYPQVAYPTNGLGVLRFTLNQTVLGSNQGSYVGYSKVTEMQNGTDQSKNGTITYQYTTDLDIPGSFSAIKNTCYYLSNLSTIMSHTYFPFFEMESRETRRGQLTEEDFYDASGYPRKSINYTYKLVSHLINSVTSSYIIISNIQNNETVTNLMGKRNLNAEKILLIGKTENEYDGAAPILQSPSVSEITNYTYCGGAYSDQFIRDKIHFSSGKVPDPQNPGTYIFDEFTEISNTYPFDYSSTASGGVMAKMTAMNYISPVINQFSTITKKTAGITYYTAAKLNDYMTNTNGSGTVGNMIVPKQLFVLNLSSPVQQKGGGGMAANPTVEVADPSNPGSLYEKRLQYLKYDGNSNPTLIQYDNLYEKLNWSLINLLLSKTQTTDPASGTGINQQTTYTYDIFQRLQSITDPGNKVRTFEYDSFGRLINIRDNNNNILTHNGYHYIGQ